MCLYLGTILVKYVVKGARCLPVTAAVTAAAA
jgi:hypothetical protein